MQKNRKIIISIAISLVLCLASLTIEVQTKMIRHAIDNALYDSWNHYLPCDAYLVEATVRSVLDEHQDVLHAIEAVNPGQTGVDLDTSACPGKADLLIWYASHQDRLEIEQIIDSETFFGVPYRLRNR